MQTTRWSMDDTGIIRKYRIEEVEDAAIRPYEMSINFPTPRSEA